MLHNAADDDALAISDCVDIDFDRAVEIAIDQQGTLLRGLQRLFEIAAQSDFVGDNFHRAPAEDVGGANQYRIADCGRTA